MRIKIPFQFKIYLLIALLFTVVLYLTTQRIDGILTTQILNVEKEQFKGLKTLFYNLLNSKIESLENEALLLAGQSQLRQTLEEGSSEASLQKLLNQQFPRMHRWPLLVVTNREGEVVSGRLIDPQQETAILETPQLIQEYLPTPELMREVLQGFHLVRYQLVQQKRPLSLYVLSSVPVYSLQNPEEIIGSVTLGYSIDQSFAFNLRSGSRYHIAFVVEDQIVTSTLDSTRMLDLSHTWDRVMDHQSLIDEPQVIPLHEERYLIYASPLPTILGSHGYYLILNSLEETLTSIQQMHNSIFWVSLIILCGIMIVAYILARGVASPVRQLAMTVSRIANGDYSIDPQIHTGDELEELGNEIHTMALTLQKRDAEIKEYVKQIEGWNKELESKVTERTKDLEEKNMRLCMISEELGRAYARIDDEFKTVGEFQRRLLPKTSYDRDGVSIRSIYIPNGRAGGDYYDFIAPSPDRLYIIIADVSGHGTPAAFVMGITRAIAHTIVNAGVTPSDILLSLNNILLKMVRSGEFVTMFIGCLDFQMQKFTYAAAGHPPPLLYRKENLKMRELEVNQGLPLGILEDSEYDIVSIHIQPGDRLLLYTDGIVEAFNEKKTPYGLHRLQELMEKNADIAPEDLLELIMHDLEAYVDKPIDLDPLDDDVTLVAVDFKEVNIPASAAS